MSNDQWNPYNPDTDPEAFVSRGEAERLAKQTLYGEVTRAGLENAYYGSVPQHRAVPPLVYAEWNTYVASHPDQWQALQQEAATGQVGPALQGAFEAIRQGVDAKLQTAGRREGASESDWRDRRIRDFEDTDENREQAIREEQAAKAKLKELR